METKQEFESRMRHEKLMAIMDSKYVPRSARNVRSRSPPAHRPAPEMKADLKKEGRKKEISSVADYERAVERVARLVNTAIQSHDANVGRMPNRSDYRKRVGSNLYKQTQDLNKALYDARHLMDDVSPDTLSRLTAAQSRIPHWNESLHRAPHMGMPVQSWDGYDLGVLENTRTLRMPMERTLVAQEAEAETERVRAEAARFALQDALDRRRQEQAEMMAQGFLSDRSSAYPIPRQVADPQVARPPRGNMPEIP